MKSTQNRKVSVIRTSLLLVFVVYIVFLLWYSFSGTRSDHDGADNDSEEVREQGGGRKVEISFGRRKGKKQRNKAIDMNDEQRTKKEHKVGKIEEVDKSIDQSERILNNAEKYSDEEKHLKEAKVLRRQEPEKDNSNEYFHHAFTSEVTLQSHFEKHLWLGDPSTFHHSFSSSTSGDQQVTLRFTKDGNRGGLMSKKTFSRNNQTIKVKWEDIKVQPSAVFALYFEDPSDPFIDEVKEGEKRKWGKWGNSIEIAIFHPRNEKDFPPSDELPVEQQKNDNYQQHQHHLLSSHSITIWKFHRKKKENAEDEVTSQILYNAEKKAAVKGVSLLISPLSIIFYFHFKDNTIFADVANELYIDGFDSRFKIGAYSYSPSIISISSVQVNKFHGECLTPTMCLCHSTHQGPDCIVPSALYDEPERPTTLTNAEITEYFDEQKRNEEGTNGDQSEVKKRLRDELKRKQFGSKGNQIDKDSCVKEKSMVFSQYSGYGLWSSLHHMMLALDWCFRNNRSLIPRFNDNWMVATQSCPQKGFDCFFQPMSKCTEKEIWGSDWDNKPYHPLNDKMVYKDERIVQYDRVMFHLYGYHQGWNGFDTNPLIDHIPSSYRNQLPSLDGLWWRSEMLNFIVKPNQAVTSEINRIKKSLNWDAIAGKYPIIGMHIRGTDKIRAGGEGRPIDLSLYYKKLKMIFDIFRGCVKHVFLATDDPDILSYVEKNWKEQFELMYISDETRLTEGDVPLWRGEKKNDKFDRHRAAVYSIANVMLLSECHFFIGTFSSNMGRAAYELLVARKGTKSIGVSLDWSFYERVT